MKVKLISFSAMLISKLSFVLFSAYVGNEMGENELVYYVYILNLVAALGALSMIPINPNILSSGSLPGFRVHNASVFIGLLLVLVFCFICFSFFIFVEGAQVSNVSEMEIYASVFFYMFGLYFGGFSIALQNQKKMWLTSGCFSLVLYLAPVLVFILFSKFLLVEHSISSFFGLFFVSSFILLYYSKSFFCFKRGRGFSMSSILSLVRPVVNGLYGVMFLVGFFMINHFVVQSQSESVSILYSWCYIVFSMTLFIPSILGSFVVPLMSDINSSYRYRSILTLYTVFSLSAILFLYYFRELGLSLYGLEQYFGDEFDLTMKFVLLASFFAVINSFFIQYFLSRRLYKLLNICTSVWFFVILVSCFVNVGSLNFIFGSLSFAYVLLILCCFSFYKRQENEAF